MTIDAPQKIRIPALRALWKEAFGDSDEFISAFEQTAFSTERCRCVTLSGTVVTSLYWFDCSYRDSRIAYLYAIVTAKQHRGQGLCSALLEDTHYYLKTLGYEGAILVPGSEKLFEFYKKFGYSVCSYIKEFCCHASSSKRKIQQINAIEYAKLRRVFLHGSGVIQENENLQFLQTQASFYTGEDFLLVARREKDTIYGIELLGNTTTAPDIVQSLGCVEGRFRTPGTGKSFAMYRSLGDKNLEPPVYFGLAFD